jgi:hypothetical protein
MIAPFWDDLISPINKTSLWTWSDDSRKIFQWTNWGFYKVSFPLGTFQAHLLKNNTIVFQYTGLQGNNRSFGSSATVGIEDSVGEQGFTILFESPSLYTGLCYHIHPDGECGYTWTASEPCPDILVTVPDGPEVPVDLAYSRADAAFTWAPSARANLYQLFLSEDPSFRTDIFNATDLTEPKVPYADFPKETLFYWQASPPPHPLL